VCELGGEYVIRSSEDLGESIDVKNDVANLEVFVCLVEDLIRYPYSHHILHDVLL
jgi:hypothetical protein